MNYTTIEQSQALIEAGLNPDTADMFYNRMKSEDDEIDWTIHAHPLPKLRALFVEYIPCWSTGALIELLPKTIRRKCMDYPLHIHPNPDSSYDIEYNAKVIAEIGFNKNSLIIAVMEMVFWLLKNGFIKKVEQ